MPIEKEILWLNKFGNLEVTQNLAGFSGFLAVFTMRYELQHFPSIIKHKTFFHKSFYGASIAEDLGKCCSNSCRP